MDGLDFGGIGPHAFCSENCTVEGDLGLSDMAFRAVEDNAMLGCCLHKLQEVPVMFCRGAALDTNIIIYGSNTQQTVHYLVHAHLNDVLGNLQDKRHVQELVPAMMSVKSDHIRRLFIELNAPEAIFSIQLTEACSTMRSMRNLLKGRSFIVPLHNCLV